jgi:kynurenine 3-monooxygenase
MGKDRTITIVGAGPVGSLMAIFLARRGLKVVVYERRPDMRREEIPAGRSINLALANRGIDALSRVDLMDQVEKHLIPMRGRMIHGPDGALQLQPYGSKPHEVIYSVSRGELNKTLMTAAEASGVEIRFNQRCDAVDLTGNTLSVTDETSGRQETVAFDVVIGADGGGSAVRKAITNVTHGTVDDQPLDHSYKELTISPKADGTHRLDPNALHIWPRGGYMLIALPNTDGSFTATLFLPNSGVLGFDGLTSGEDVQSFFADQFSDAVPLIAGLADSFFANPIGRLGTIRCDRWSYLGKGLLMGDAAHAIVPFHGQGMNAGFEDCVALDRCLEQCGDDWERVFPDFQIARKTSADAIADMALENYVEMRDSVRDPKFQLRKELAWKLEALYPDRFIPRYSMVMFHLLPYADAYTRGRVQEKILVELTVNAETIDDVDFDRAQALVESNAQLLPALHSEETP